MHCRPAGIQRQLHLKHNQQWKEETRAGLQQQLAWSAHAFDLARCPILHVSVLSLGTSQEDPHKEDTSQEGYTRYIMIASGSRAGSSKSLYASGTCSYCSTRQAGACCSPLCSTTTSEVLVCSCLQPRRLQPRPHPRKHQPALG